MKLQGAECHDACRGRWARTTIRLTPNGLRDQLGDGEFTGVVVLTAPPNGNPEEQFALRGRDYVQHLVRIARELPESQVSRRGCTW